MKLLITGAWNCTEEQLDQIKDMGHNIVFMQNEKDNLPCNYEKVEGVICNGLFLHHNIERFTSLRYIQLTSVGYDRVPIEYVQQHGIKLYNARGVYSVPMAEYALCGVLALYKKSPVFYDNQKEAKWEKQRDLLELFGKTVCIVGCGNVGTECAKRFNAFGCKVVGVDLYTREDTFYEKIYPLKSLDMVLAQSDVVVLTVPLTDETKHMMNNQRFSAMKKGSVIVNIARGAIIEEKALLSALEEKLLGVVLDVFEEEPLSQESDLWEKKNVIITPHNSFVGEGNSDRLNYQIIKNLQGE